MRAVLFFAVGAGAGFALASWLRSKATDAACREYLASSVRAEVGSELGSVAGPLAQGLGDGLNLWGSAGDFLVTTGIKP